MTDLPNSRIARSFGAAAPTYDKSAQIQRLAVEDLMAVLRPHSVQKGAKVLEIGCGTGLLSEPLVTEIAPEADEIYLTDIAEGMVSATKQRLGERNGVGYRILDGEAPTLRGQFDLITSSMTFQWFKDLPGALRRLGGLLAPDGKLIFLTLGSDSFKEWRKVHSDLNVPCATPHYPSACDLPGKVTERHVEAHYPHGMAFLRALRDIGAHISRDDLPPMNPALLRALVGALDRSSGPDVVMTYHFLTIELTAEDLN